MNRLFIFLLMTLMTGWVRASTLAPGKTDYALCRDDYVKFCSQSNWESTVKSDYSCLQVRFKDLAPSCRELVLKKSQDVCFSEAVRICPGQLANYSQRGECLWNQRQKLSNDCLKDVAKKKIFAAKAVQACGESISTTCPLLANGVATDCFQLATAENATASCLKYLKDLDKKSTLP